MLLGSWGRQDMHTKFLSENLKPRDQLNWFVRLSSYGCHELHLRSYSFSVFAYFLCFLENGKAAHEGNLREFIYQVGKYIENVLQDLS